MNPRLFLPALLAASLAHAQPAAPDAAAAKADNPPAAAADAQTEMQKWIAATDAPWQATFQRDVTAVHEAEVKKAMLQYLTLLDDAIGKASKASDLDGAVALRNEQKRFGDTQLFPEQDEAGDPAAVKQARATIRAQLAQLEKNRGVRAKALHAKYDPVLAQAQAQLTQAKRLDDALLVKAKREEVAKEWLGGLPAVAAAQPAPTKPVAGTTGTTKAPTPAPSLVIPLNARPAESMTIYASGSNSCVIHVNGKLLTVAKREKPSIIKQRLKEGDVIAVHNKDRYDINSFWLSCIASTGEFLFETSEEWKGYIPADPGKWWDTKNIKEQAQVTFTPERQQYVDTVKNSASQTPLYTGALPIRSNQSDGTRSAYLYHVVTKMDLIPKKDRGNAAMKK